MQDYCRDEINRVDINYTEGFRSSGDVIVDFRTAMGVMAFLADVYPPLHRLGSDKFARNKP